MKCLEIVLQICGFYKLSHLIFSSDLWYCTFFPSLFNRRGNCRSRRIRCWRKAVSSGAKLGLKSTLVWAPIATILSCHRNASSVCLGTNAVLTSYVGAVIRLSKIKSWLYCPEAVWHLANPFLLWASISLLVKRDNSNSTHFILWDVMWKC